MTCGHCVRAVTDAIHAVDPGAVVEVDLDAGRVTVRDHAVFISASDLTYVHAHAAPALGLPTLDLSTGHDMPGMEMPGRSLPPGSKVPSNLALHVRAPSAGR